MDQETLKKYMSYNPENGLFTWVASTCNKIKPGMIAGSQRKDGYIEIRLHGELMLAHRMVFLYLNGEWPEVTVDHISGVRNDNRFSNLRLASYGENARNVKMHGDNQSGYKGVFWCKRSRKWIGKICVRGRQVWLGSYDNPEDAHAAYVKASAELHRDFGRTA